MEMLLATHVIVLRLARARRLNTYRYVLIMSIAFISSIAAKPLSFEKDRDNTFLLGSYSFPSPLNDNVYECFKIPFADKSMRLFSANVAFPAQKQHSKRHCENPQLPKS